ncbi:MAG: SdrD B-like domain-containing protein, partial [Prosthecobacter sp.]
MRRLLRHLLIGMAALAASGGALAQSVTVLDYNFGTTSTPVLTPSTRHNNVVPGNPLMLTGNQMTSVPRFNTSGNTTGFMEYNNWPTSESGSGSWASGTRTNLNPTLVGPTLWTRFTLGPNSSFTLSALAAQLRYQRPSSTSPNNVRACLTWFDGTAFRRRYSPTVNLTAAASTTTWTGPINVTIAGTGSTGDTLPTGTAMSGRTFLLELQFWGSTSASNKINIDDVKLLADTAVTGATAWVTPASLPGGNVSVPYFQRLQAGSGNVASHTYSLVSGTLPGGVSLSSGNLVGLPTAAGTFTFTLRATGSANTDRAFTLVIGAAPATAPGATLALYTFDNDPSRDVALGPDVMSACLAEGTWGFDERGNLGFSNHAEGTVAGSLNPITPDRATAGKMRCFSGWDVGDNYLATRNSLLHVVDGTGSSAQWHFGVKPTTNTGSIPPAAYSSTGETAALQFSTTFRPTATGTLRSFKVDLLRWLKEDMVNDGTLGARYVRLYAYYTNDAGVVQRWTGSTQDVNAIYYGAMQSANQNQFRTFWWDLSTLHTAINATTAKYANRKIMFELYSYYEHGYDPYLIPVTLIDDVGILGDFTCPTVSIGNLVWDDLDNDGVKDTGESGLAGAQVELFSPGADNAIGGTGGNADTKIGSTITTTATGAYNFTNLDPGNYYVKVTPPSTHFLTGGVPDIADNAEDNDNNGAQPGGRGTALFSPVI